jgi:hypothetical protein
MRTAGEGIVDAGNVCCRQLKISCTCIFRDVLGSGSFGNGKKSGAAHEELERHLARGGMLKFGYFAQHMLARRVRRRECSMTQRTVSHHSNFMFLTPLLLPMEVGAAFTLTGAHNSKLT